MRYAQRCSDSVSHSLNTRINLADPDDREELFRLKDRILRFLTDENAIIIAHVIHFANITGLTRRGLDILYKLGKLIQENHNDPLKRLRQIIKKRLNKYYKVTDLCPSHRDLSEWFHCWVIDSQIYHDDSSGTVCEDSASYDYEEAEDARYLYCEKTIPYLFLKDFVFDISQSFNLDCDLEDVIESTDVYC